MRKHLLIVLLMTIPFFGNSQIFQEDFDGNGPGFSAWTLIDVDGLTHAADVSDFNAGAWIRKDRGGPIPNYGGPDGNYAAMSSSWYNPAGTSNDWLITPVINLPASAAFLQWDAKAQDPNYRDGYKVMLAPNGGNTVADFTVELFSTPTAGENAAWTTRTLNLANYVNTNVRIAFVNNSNDKYILLIDNVSVKLAPTSPPNCPTLTSPANAATGVNYLSPVTLSWTAPSGGEPAISYDVFLGTSANPTTLLANVTGTTASATNLLASTTYYWRVESKNAAGNSTGCTEFTFTTAANPFAPYCGPLVFTTATEPITLVNFAGINNVTSPTVNGTPNHENFTSISGNVEAGSSYTITLQGNTAGNFTNRFVVFIDWNQNGILDDAGEMYEITSSLVNSTGTDGKQVTQSLAVPASALPGSTRMRVKKIFSTTNYLNPCLGAGYGQAEDYSINVTTLAVSDAQKMQAKVYPNPVVDMMNIESPIKVNSISVYDLSGKAVSQQTLNATKSQVNLSNLESGVYMVNITTDNGTQTVKIIKK